MSPRMLSLMSCLVLASAATGGCTPWKTKSSHTAEKAQRDDRLRQAGVAEAVLPDRDPQLSTGVLQTASDGSGSSGLQHAAPSNQFLLGRQAENSGQLQLAQQHYRTVIRNSPRHAHAHHRLGVVADKLQEYASAERHYQTALNYLAPENHHERSIVLSDLGYSHLLQGDFPHSEAALNEALKYNEHSGIAWRNLGLLYGYRGDYKRAFQAFAQAGGEAEAQAKLDRLFPQWRANQQRTIAGRQDPAGLPEPLAGRPTPMPSADSTTAFPATPTAISQAAGKIVQSVAQSPSGTSDFSIHRAGVPTTSPLDPEAFPRRAALHEQQFPTRDQFHRQADRGQTSQMNPIPAQDLNSPAPVATAPLTEGQSLDFPEISHGAESIQAPLPAGYSVSVAAQQPPPRQHSDAVFETGNSNSSLPAEHVMHRITPIQQPSTPPSAVKNSNFPAERQASDALKLKLSARQTALRWGSAASFGGMFPTTDIGHPQNETTSHTHVEATTGTRTNSIRQVSAELQNSPVPVDPIDQFDAALKVRHRELREQRDLQHMLNRQSIPINPPKER